jgi:hypothetical protein
MLYQLSYASQILPAGRDKLILYHDGTRRATGTAGLLINP